MEIQNERTRTTGTVLLCYDIEQRKQAYLMLIYCNIKLLKSQL